MKKGNAKRLRRPNRFLYALGKAVLIPYFKLRYRFRVVRHDLPELKPPYVVVANHASSLDFMLMILAMKGLDIRIVTATVFFYDPLLRIVLRWMGCISKLQMVSDPSSIRQMLTAVREDGVLGLFPHGQVCHSGCDLPLPPGTGKLLQRMQVPVVNIKIHGASLTKPKWAYRQRKGRIEAHVQMLFTPEQLKSMPTELVEETIREAIRFDDYEFNRTWYVPFSSKAPAEGLERILYQCPRCNSLYTMQSKGDAIFCSACSNGARMDEYGQLHPLHDGDIIFEDPVKWAAFEREFAKRELKDGSLCQKATLYVGDDRNPRFIRCGEGMVTLTKDEFRFDGTKYGEPFTHVMSTCQLAGLPVSIKSTYWEIPGAKEYYRFVPECKQSLLHMVLGLEAVHEMLGETGQS